MYIPVVDLKIQYRNIKRQIDDAIRDVLESGQFILGDAVEKFEEGICKYCDVKYAVGVASGTDAIMLSLISLGIGKGDGVIVPSFTYFATVGAIIHSGAIPVLVDIDPKTYNIDPRKIEERLKRPPTPRLRRAGETKIKAIIPVHLYGQMADLKAIMAIAKKYRLYVIEDAAQAFGATQFGRFAGRFGDLGCFSFYPTKNLGGYGDGGAIITNNAKVAKRLSILRRQGDIGGYNHVLVGYNSRLDAIQAAILNLKLKYIEKWNRHRQIIAKFYDNTLACLGIGIPYVSEANTHTYHQYVIRTPRKEALLRYLNKNGIDARTYYPIPQHLAKCLKYLGYKKGDFPETELAARETVALPIYPELSLKQRHYIVQTIKKFFNK